MFKFNENEFALFLKAYLNHSRTVVQLLMTVFSLE